MLQDIRQNIQGTAAKIVVGLIVISFSIFGIESILLSGSGGGIAEVNGEEISPVEVQQLVSTEKRRLISMLGDNIDPAMLDDQRLGAQALQSIISRKLQTQAAADMKLTAAESQIGAAIGGMEQFQLDGQFSAEVYKNLLLNAGYTPGSFKQGLKEDLILNQLRSGLAGSDFATASELALNARILGELRDVRYLTIPLQNFIASVNVSDSEIERYYDDRKTDFLSEETLELEYIELQVDDFRQPVDESALLEAYELEKDSYAYAAENRVSHILFQAEADESDEQVQARADAVLAELAVGIEFSELAVSFSDDIGSASSGGDLGFSSGGAFPEEMEEAIAALEVGGISGLVQTDAGLHLIKLTERREGKVSSFDELRGELQERIQVEAARAELLRTVESLRDYVFNAPDLAEPSEELGLTIKQSEPVFRSQQNGLFSNASLLAAAFSEDVLEGGHNSEVIELGNSRFVVLRVAKHNPAEVQAIEAVRQEIVLRITENTATAAVSAEAQKALQALQSGTGVEAFANENSYEWQVELASSRGNTAIPAPALRRAFELPAPAEGESTFEYVLTPTGDALVFELVRVAVGEFSVLGESEKLGLTQQLSQEFGSLVNVEYQNGLRDRADITVM